MNPLAPAGDYEPAPLITPFRLTLAAVIAGLAVWMSLWPADWQNWLGFSKYDYFVAGQNYAAFSGPVPVILTALLGSTVIGGLWHHLNCHTAGCPRIVRHKIAGGEYGVCSTHWRQIHNVPRRQKFTVEHLREHHLAHQRRTTTGISTPRLRRPGEQQS